MLDTLMQFVTGSWLVLGQMAPYLLFGFLVAGVLSVFISPAWVERHLGGRGMKPVLAASLFGVPLPLCSCGVIPVSASIRRHGASRAATSSFLLSTPQTGVDSIFITYAMLGTVFAVFRPVAALITGIIGGALVLMFGETEEAKEIEETSPNTCSESCCAGKKESGKILEALRYGLIVLPRDIGPALLVGILIAGAIGAFVPQNQLGPYMGGGIVSILILMAAGVPVYVCATASVPIAAGFMHMGASPGAALAFLISGPATNTATLTTVWKVLGRRTAVVYLVSIAISAITCGLALDWLIPAAGAALPRLGTHAHEMAETGWFFQGSAVLLLAVIGFSYYSNSTHVKETAETDELTAEDLPDRQSLEFQVSGMTCSQCAASVARALGECDGVLSADVDLHGGSAVVVGRNLDREQLLSAVTGLGYEPTLLDTDRPDNQEEDT